MIIILIAIVVFHNVDFFGISDSIMLCLTGSYINKSTNGMSGTLFTAKNAALKLGQNSEGDDTHYYYYETRGKVIWKIR